MTEAKQESKYWGLYDRFGVTVGFITPKNRTITAGLQIDGFYATDQGDSGNGYNLVLGYIF